MKNKAAMQLNRVTITLLDNHVLIANQILIPCSCVGLLPTKALLSIRSGL
jgi:hypothetical protein